MVGDLGCRAFPGSRSPIRVLAQGFGDILHHTGALVGFPCGTGSGLCRLLNAPSKLLDRRHLGGSSRDITGGQLLTGTSRQRFRPGGEGADKLALPLSLRGGRLGLAIRLFLLCKQGTEVGPGLRGRCRQRRLGGHNWRRLSVATHHQYPDCHENACPGQPKRR